MISGGLAKRYARALVELASNPAQRDTFLKQIEDFAAACTAEQPIGEPRLGEVLDMGIIPVVRRKKAAQATLQRLNADPVLVRFVDLLVERRRAGGVVLIARHYRDLVDEAAGRMRATVRSAKPLAPDATSKIKAALEKSTGRQIILETLVEPDLIGGLVTTVGSTTFDGSIRSSLDRLRTSLRDN